MFYVPKKNVVGIQVKYLLNVNSLDIIWSQVHNQKFFRQEKFCGIKTLRQAFVENTRKKDPAGKKLDFFLLNTLETTFWMELSTHGWTQLVHFFPKSGYFFRFSKKSRGDIHPLSPFPPSSRCCELGSSFLFLTLNKLLKKLVLVMKSLFYLFWHWSLVYYSFLQVTRGNFIGK